MAKTTFSGPVRSNRGFTAAGSTAMVNITAETTLTYDDHVGRIIKVNDADGAITLEEDFRHQRSQFYGEVFSPLSPQISRRRTKPPTSPLTGLAVTNTLLLLSIEIRIKSNAPLSRRFDEGIGQRAIDADAAD